jgi:hypothetical protein
MVWGKIFSGSFSGPFPRCSPLHRPFFRPHCVTAKPACPSRCPLKTTPTGEAWQLRFFVKSERPDRTAEHKKKTMKTNTNKNQVKAQSRPEQLSTKPLPKIDLALRRANRALNTERLLTLLRSETPRFFEIAEVVGKWVWIQFTEKQPSDVTIVLSELGFHWNNTRQAWQHPCGTIAFEPANYDPRKRYGSYFPADQKAA